MTNLNFKVPAIKNPGDSVYYHKFVLAQIKQFLLRTLFVHCTY